MTAPRVLSVDEAVDAVERAVERMRAAGGGREGFQWTPEAERVRESEVMPARAALRALQNGKVRRTA